MKDNYFLQGILFISIAYPLICNVISLASQGFDYLCTKIAVETANLQAEIAQKQTPVNTTAIGFQYYPEENHNKESY